MSGHADAVHRTTPRPRPCSSERGSGVGVAHPHTAPWFMPLPHADWPFASYLELGAFPTAVGCARSRAHALLKEWGLGDPDLIADAELLVSELMSNAVITTVEHRLDAPVRFRLAGNHDQVLIEIWDADPTPPPAPAAEPPSGMAETGRGLFLVQTLGTRWSWYALNPACGKVVWVEVAQ